MNEISSSDATSDRSAAPQQDPQHEPRQASPTDTKPVVRPTAESVTAKAPSTDSSPSGSSTLRPVSGDASPGVAPSSGAPTGDASSDSGSSGDGKDSSGEGSGRPAANRNRSRSRSRGRHGSGSAQKRAGSSADASDGSSGGPSDSAPSSGDGPVPAKDQNQTGGGPAPRGERSDAPTQKSGRGDAPDSQLDGSKAPAQKSERGGDSRVIDEGRRASRDVSRDQPVRDDSSPMAGDSRNPTELPKPEREGRPSVEAAEAALVRRPQIGDSKPSPIAPEGQSKGDVDSSSTAGSTDGGSGGGAKRRRRRGGRGRGSGAARSGDSTTVTTDESSDSDGQAAQLKGNAKQGSGRGDKSKQGDAKSGNGGQGRGQGGGRSGGGRGRKRGGNRESVQPVTAMTSGDAIELDDDIIEERRGANRKGRPVGRYLMAVHVRPEATQIAVLEGRHLIEHYVAKPADDETQIHGNVYLGKVQNVLPGMEAAFIDIGTPKNAVLYRGDVHFDLEDIEERDDMRIEQLLKPRQTVICQVTKNPIMHKGARLTQEVSLPGRFVVLVPNSKTLGISKRLPEPERKRLRSILNDARPAGHGVIVRTAAEGITGPEIVRDLERLVKQWAKIEELAKKTKAPALLYREPDMALRVIREEFSRDYRRIVIDDKEVFEEVRDYVASVSPALTERIAYYDRETEPLSVLEKHHVLEQLHRGLDRRVWLPSGGTLIIEHTEALTVIDVNTGKNVGTSNLEDTVFKNNLEAAEEIARQLRLRDVGGIIVIDYVDMEIKANRAKVIKVFRDALARDKTRTQVFDISELGLVQMTRKRIGEGLLESFSSTCEVCEGRGVVFDQGLLE